MIAVKRRIFHDTIKVYEIHISVFIMKFYWNTAMLLVCGYFLLQQKLYLPPKEPEMWPSCTLWQKFASPWSVGLLYGLEMM